MWRLSWRLFRAISGAGYWIQRCLTVAGLVVLGAAILAAAFGVDTNQSVAYRIFTTLAALLLVAAAASRFVTARLEVARELPRAVAAGDAFEYRVRIRNPGPRPVEGATLLEDLGDPRPALATFRASAKAPTYAGWLKLIERNRVAHVGPLPIPAVGAGSEVEVRVTAQAYRRGRLRFEGSSVGVAEPLGLVRRTFRAGGPGQVLVLPRRYKLPPHLSLPGARRYQHGGVTLSSSVGDSQEFLGLREYRPGDPRQRIHWKSFAKLGVPVVHEYQDEFFERYALVLDTFAAEGTAFEEAVAVAASLAETIDTQECLLDLVFVGAEAYSFTAGRGQLQPAGLLEILAGVQPFPEGKFRVLRDAVRAKRASISGLLLVLLAWDEPRQELVRELRASGVALRVVLVSATPVPDSPGWLAVLQPGRIQQGLAAL